MPDFSATNEMTAFDSFHNRMHFQENAYNLVEEYLLMDLLYENPLYGKVDNKFNSIYPKADNLKLFHPGIRSLWALDFVVDAFMALRKHMAQASMLKKINISRSFIGDFIPHRAYENSNVFYRNHLESYIGTFSTIHLMEDPELQNKVTTFDDFFREFRKYIYSNAMLHPLTKSSFIKSKYCTSGISGLMIDISDNPESDDWIKMRNYIKDPSFNFYINAARKFGFYVDKNCPWRLIADISSANMFEFMKPYGIGSITELFSGYYTQAYTADISLIKQGLFDMYNEFVDEFPFATKNYLIGCADGTMRPSQRFQNYSATTSHVPRQPISQQEFENKYPDIFWILFYLHVRLLEVRFKPNPRSLQILEENIVRRYKLALSSSGNDFFLAYRNILRYTDNQVLAISENRYRRAKFGAEMYLEESRHSKIIDNIRGPSIITPSYMQDVNL
tara:strand:+ start:5570 stop:6910 length:1341 start_codon:yes stop_codon:yes gene_type:complete